MSLARPVAVACNSASGCEPITKLSDQSNRLSSEIVRMGKSDLVMGE